MEAVASGLVYAGLVTCAVGASNILKPWPRVGVRRRRAGALVLLTGAVLLAVGMTLPSRERRVERAVTHLDALMPAWQFAERHTIRIQAPRDRVYEAVKDVRAEEIRFFRALTWIRHPRWPGRPAPESILAPPPRQPILAVALRSGFVLLADDPGRELVVGAIVCCEPADARRLLPRLRAEGAPAFTALAEAGVATAAMSFVLEEDAGATRLTTETRVHATDVAARRRFAAYWRLIYPGSSIIRSMWLRAIKARAEAPAGRG